MQQLRVSRLIALLLPLALVAGASGAKSKPTKPAAIVATVRVVIDDARFTLSRSRVPVGVVRFVVVNKASTRHDFAIARRHTGPLKPGTRRSLDVRFRLAGRYRYACTISQRVCRGKQGVLTVGKSRVATPPPAPPTPTDQQWLSYGHDDQQTNAVVSATLDSRTAPSLAIRWDVPVSGWMGASPVAATVEDRTVVYAATEAGGVHALSAEDGSKLWTRLLGAKKVGSGYCGEWGVSSTPAIDMVRGLLYVIGASGLLHALDLSTGAEAPGYPLDITAKRNDVEYVWGGLRIVGDRLFIPVASYCDNLDRFGQAAEGRYTIVDLEKRAISATWDPVPGENNLGGTWGYGGITVEPGGDFLYTGIGNAWVKDAQGKAVEDAGYGQDLVKLDATSLEVLASNKPMEVESTGGDQDFGAAPTLFQPSGCPPLAAMNNKVGYLFFFWDRRAIADGPIARLGLNNGATPFTSGPSWSGPLNMAFDAGTTVGKESTGVTAIRFRSGCTPTKAWEVKTGSGPQPQPLIVNDVVFAVGGESGLNALAATDGFPLWHLDTDGPALSPPIEVAGTVYVSVANRMLALAPAAS